MTQQTVAVRVACVDPPTMDGTLFGLQDKDGDLQPGDKDADGSLTFTFALDVRPHDDGTPNFTGSYAHGARAERFLYLSLSDNNGGYIKRIKIPLKTITWAQVEAALAGDGASLAVTVSGAGAATVPLVGDGWTVAADS